jgi:hypothetical protein
MMLGTLLVRSLYIFMHRKHHYPDDQVYLLVLGSKTIKLLAVAMLLVLCLLGFRVRPGIVAGQFWQLDSLTRGWWCIIRICIGMLAALCASVFETHWLFRAWASLTVPLAATLDLLSQAQFAVHISCIDHGLCQPDDALLQELYALAWRDIVSAILTVSCTSDSAGCGVFAVSPLPLAPATDTFCVCHFVLLFCACSLPVQLMFFGVSTWLWFLYGLVGNDVVLPRAEHRRMAAQLDKVKLKPKETRPRIQGAAGRQYVNEDENQLEKMLGYN